MNAAADRLEDGYPHGTPDGYAQGCRGTVCPGADMYGLSCKRAKQLAASDYGYQKLAKRGLTPGEIALELGLIPEAPTAPVVPRKPRPTAEAPAPTAEEPEAAVIEPAPAPAARPSQSEIRAWARSNGIDVNPKGSVRTDVVNAYLAAHSDPLHQEQATAAPAVDTPTEPDITHLPVHADATAELIDQIRDRIDMPAADTAHVDENALADATTEPDEGVEISTPGEFAARWNRLTDEERIAWITGMRIARAAAERCITDNHATLVELRDTRPDWATVATTEDLAATIEQRDQARRFATRYLEELTHLEAREESALTLALTRWAAAAAERDHLATLVTALTAELDTSTDVEERLAEAHANLRALATITEERDALAAQLTLTMAVATDQHEEIERQRRVIEEAARNGRRWRPRRHAAGLTDQTIRSEGDE